MDIRIRTLRAKAKGLEPTLQIGKSGVQEGNIALIDRELESKHLIKIRFHKGALPEDASKAGRRALAQRLAESTKSVVVEQVGSVVVLYRS
jgi:putative YhbY family RNA-binding protein